jgi:carboxyl-terminal processing protease
MKNETHIRRVFNFSIALALVLSFLLGFQVSGLARYLTQEGKLPPAVAKTLAGLSLDVKATPERMTDSDLRVFYEVLSYITQTYLNRDELKNQDVVRGAAIGAVDSLGDRYSRFVPPVDQQSLSEEIEGEYAGAGISIIDRPMVLPPYALKCEIESGGDEMDPFYARELRGVVVVQAFENGPAYEVGLKANDVILCVDGHDLRGKVAEDAVALIKGPPDTTIHITVWRASTEEELSFDLTRRIVQVPTVGKKEMLTSTVGYIRLDTFNNLSPGDVKSAISELLGQGMKGLIFDLRNNTGGPLTAAVGIADQFIPDGNLVYYEDSAGTKEAFPSEDNGAALNLPLVILTNANTASASEIVAGAVRDTHEGLLVGENTFGKGVVQNVYNLSDGSGLVLTTGRYLTPALHEITQEGLTPDILSNVDPETLRAVDPQIGAFMDRVDRINKDFTALREEMVAYLDEHDFQKEKALEVIDQWLQTGEMPAPENPPVEQAQEGSTE